MNAPPVPAQASRATFTLALLGFIYLMNFLDRTLIYILFPPIKAEMSFSDLQLALLGSTSFVIFYTLLGIPFGHLADRVSRVKMIAAGLVTWSVFSALTGLAWDFWSIFACRVMVGVGEATLGPAAMSLLSDLFPPSRRATVQSVYSAGIPLGAAAAFFLGGQIAAAYSWRTAFLALGLPGVALAGILLLTVVEPRRGGTEVAGTSPGVPSSAVPAPGVETREMGGLRVLLRNPALRWHTLGYASMAIAANTLSIWIPKFFAGAYNVPLTTIGNLSGLSMAIAGGLATAFGGSIADRFQGAGPGGRLRFSLGLAVVCLPLWFVLLFSGNVAAMFCAYFLLAGLGLAWLGPAAADVHDMVGPKLRGLGIAAYFFVVNVVGYGIVPPIVGRISDRLGVATDPGQMRYALLSAPLGCLFAVFFLWKAAGVRREQLSRQAARPVAPAASPAG